MSAGPEIAESVRDRLRQLQSRVAETIHGKDGVIEDVLTALVAGGHLLIEDLPGLGKTTLAYCLARALDCGFQRIQFTSDMLPADILGVSVYDESRKDFVFRKGPVFTSILLADEINRSTPKTQSALLEAMDRGKVSMDGVTYDLGRPFMVFATQNPVDFEGTFPLPDSQMDRFLMRLQMGYAAFEDELNILKRGMIAYDSLKAEPLFHADDVLSWQKLCGEVYVEESVSRYLLELVSATRVETEFRAGISTRGALALQSAAQARALLRGREFVVPDDVLDVYLPVCTHRISLRRQSSDLLEERAAVEAHLRRIQQRIRHRH